nr:MAG TPA: hypothetical protein [Caudoviricetes sp.]
MITNCFIFFKIRLLITTFLFLRKRVYFPL